MGPLRIFPRNLCPVSRAIPQTKALIPCSAQDGRQGCWSLCLSLNYTQHHQVGLKDLLETCEIVVWLVAGMSSIALGLGSVCLLFLVHCCWDLHVLTPYQKKDDVLWKGADSLVIASGLPDDDNPYKKTNALQTWLLGYPIIILFSHSPLPTHS